MASSFALSSSFAPSSEARSKGQNSRLTTVNVVMPAAKQFVVMTVDRRAARNIESLCFMVGVLADELVRTLEPEAAKRVQNKLDVFVRNLEPMSSEVGRPRASRRMRASGRRRVELDGAEDGPHGVG